MTILLAYSIFSQYCDGINSQHADKIRIQHHESILYHRVLMATHVFMINTGVIVIFHSYS